ncbi:hypothetical protein [Achromobacter xylosoxidans]|uniref:hypothetical protein n=1 Tax=Alcaligenes xylosoxydans xylosoxydans TaxID=85698 RepID=UPI0012DCC0F5|nr:hypothetical protein [Achromobacter xylosoxidans]
MDLEKAPCGPFSLCAGLALIGRRTKGMAVARRLRANKNPGARPGFLFAVISAGVVR